MPVIVEGERLIESSSLLTAAISELAEQTCLRQNPTSDRGADCHDVFFEAQEGQAWITAFKMFGSVFDDGLLLQV